MNIDKETIQALKKRAKEMLNNDYSRKIGDEEIHTIICEWEYTLSELETYKKANDNSLVKNVELKIELKTLEQSNKNLLAKKSELETWKKIAEKLAEQVKRDTVFYDSKGISSCDLSEEKYCKCSKHNNGANCNQCIIDWARNEVK